MRVFQEDFSPAELPVGAGSEEVFAYDSSGFLRVWVPSEGNAVGRGSQEHPVSLEKVVEVVSHGVSRFPDSNCFHHSCN